MTTTTDSPTPNTPLTADDWLPGDWLLLDGQPVRFRSQFMGGIRADDGGGKRISALALDRFQWLGRPDQSGWIPHDGGPNPAPGVDVVARYRPGCTVTSTVGRSDSVWWLDVTHWRPHVPAPAGEAKCPCVYCSELGAPELCRGYHEAPPQPKGEVEAAVERLERAAKGERLDRIYGAGRQPSYQHADDLRTLLSALTASQAREARAVEAALIAGFLHGVGRQQWEDMHDYIALCARDYAKGQALPPRKPLSEFIDNGENGG